MKRKNRLILMFLLLAGFVFSANLQTLSAQNQLEIFNIFDKYGNKKGVTHLEASAAVMKDYEITQFKSIIFDDGTSVLPEIRKCIEKDKQGAAKIKEETKDGKVVNGYYRLKNLQPQINRYLIFKVGAQNKVTLLYIEGKITPEGLVELLK